MQQRVHEVRLEFYKMIRNVLVAFTTDKMLNKFNGANLASRHMTKFIKWQDKHDIFLLINKSHFKHEAKTTDDIPLYKQPFYQRLIYYPILQNYIADKFFPKSVEDNIK